MSGKRECKCYAAVGMTGIGKTYETLKMIYKYVQGDKATGNPPKRVLILDVNNEFSMFKVIDIKDIKLFSVHPKIEVRRVTVFKADGGTKSLDEIAGDLFYILNNFRNGLFLIEDLSKYISDSLPGDLVGSMFTKRHIGVDIVMHFQMIGKIAHPKIIAGTGIVRMHKYEDDVERRKNDFLGKYEVLKIAQNIIETDYENAILNKDYRNSGFMMGKFVMIGSKEDYKSGFVEVDMERRKISGKFSKGMFDKAVKNFIQYNERYALRPFTVEKNDDGKAIYNYKQSMDLAKQRLTMLYYGN